MATGTALGIAWAAHLGQAADDLVVADFDGDSYAPWTATGDAFGDGPARGALPGQMSVPGFKGKGLVNSFRNGDASTGVLTSPPFVLQRRHLCFLIGGGANAEKLALQLLLDGRVVRSATGGNSQPGGSEELAPGSWDVADLAGKTVVLRIVDDATGGWGHINVDHVVQTDRKPAGLIQDAARDVTASHRYLLVPIKTGAPKRVVTLSAGDHVIVRNDVELAPGAAEWWGVMDVGPWRGQSLRVTVDKLPEDSSGLASIRTSDTVPDAATLYREPLRGQLHFSPQRGWNNDPNGMVYFRGEYHLFFQHNPYGWAWGNMHWGHAVSRDLVSWTELGDVLMPDVYGPMFSGSAVVDWQNTSGLGTDGKPPLVLIYTAAGNPTVQCIASSTDGRTFVKYPGNPILPQVTGGNRDPKVLWHEPTRKWVMVLYVELPGRGHTVHFYTSPNLKDWSLASVTDGVRGSNYLYECPDFFELPVDGNPKDKRWVLAGANTEYAVGTFDGTRFTPEHSRLPGQRGKGFYAPQTFSDIPARDGRRIQFGWFQTETKGASFNQSMTLPLVLTLTSTPEGPRLAYNPAKEIQSLRQRGRVLRNVTVGTRSTDAPLDLGEAELLELSAEFEHGQGSVEFVVRGAVIRYDDERQEISVQGQKAPAPRRGSRQRITIFCDRTGLEVFASDGLCYVPMPFQPAPDDRHVLVRAPGGPRRLKQLALYPLRSIWHQPR
ncbi:MAG: glycoside hydrolase family 32 protein [Verrucomicrobiota bacterium]